MILVTGGSGFIGSHLLAQLAGSGDAVRALIRRKIALPTGVEAVYGDLVTGQGIADAVRGADAVIHLAGVTKALKSGDYYVGNARATEILLKALTGSPARLVHVSSLAAAGPSTDGKPVDEETAMHPVTNYGKSKLEAERMVRALAPEAVIVRPPIVYGPRDTDVFQILKSISHGFLLKIAGGERWFSMIYVRDLVEGLILAARSPQAAGRTYFLAYPQPASWSDLGAVAARIMHKRPRTVTIPQAMARAAGYCAEVWSGITGKAGIISREKVAEAACMRWTCDSKRATRELGFEACTGLDAGLAETLGWYKEAGWLKY
jgi:nucleoside-diphosphate-sugar epimerase